LNAKWVPYQSTTVTDYTAVWGWAYVWQPNAYVGVNDYCLNSGNVYQAITAAGVTANGPSGTGTAIQDGTAKWDFVGTPTYFWQASKGYANNACIMLPQNGIMWANLTGSSFTSGTTIPAGLTSSSPAATVSDGTGTWTQISLWQPQTSYTLLVSYVVANGNVYVGHTSGVSASGPSGTGSSITDNGATWKYLGVASGTWAASTSYTANSSIIVANSNTWICTTSGTSGTLIPPWLSSLGVSAGTVSQTLGNIEWCISTAYVVGQVVSNANRMYRCITAGTSASAVGPTTTLSNITDNTAHWCFMQADGYYAPPTWAISTAYNLGSIVAGVKGGTYICIVAGASLGSGNGPSGTSNGQTDNTVTWNYNGPLPVEGIYDTTTRPGTIMTQGSVILGQALAPVPTTFVLWGKIGGSYIPETINESSPCIIGFVDRLSALVENTETCVGINNTVSSGYGGPGNGVELYTEGLLTGLSYWWVPRYNSTTGGSPREICYFAIVVSGTAGATPNTFSVYLAGADRVWFKPPLTNTTANVFTNSISQSAQGLNYLFLRSQGDNQTVIPNQSNPMAMFEFIRIRPNTLNLP